MSFRDSSQLSRRFLNLTEHSLGFGFVLGHQELVEQDHESDGNP